MTDQPKRPWWRKRRWRVAGLLWLLLVAYPLSLGPLEYLSQVDLLPRPAVDVIGVAYAPLGVARRVCPPFDRAYDEYIIWWIDLAITR